MSGDDTSWLTTMSGDDTSWLTKVLLVLVQLTLFFAITWWLAKRDNVKLNLFRAVILAAYMVAIGSLPFLAAWFWLAPGNWNLLYAAILAPAAIASAVAMYRAIRDRRAKKHRPISPTH